MECEKAGCTDNVHAKNLCMKHYQQERRFKNPLQIRYKSVTNEGQETRGETPGTSSSCNIDVHRFFYYCNYIGQIDGTPLKKKGWYKLNYNDFLKVLPIINNQLKLTRDARLSIYFTRANSTMALGIEGHTWQTVEDMETDAYILTRILEDELGIETDNLRMEKLRKQQGHITKGDRSTQKMQEDGLDSYRGQTTFNPGHFTRSHPNAIQYERETDMERDTKYMGFMGDPLIEDPEDRTRGAYQGLDLSRYLFASVKIQLKTNQQIGIYATALEQHTGFVQEAKDLIIKLNSEVAGRKDPKYQHLYKGRGKRR